MNERQSPRTLKRGGKLGIGVWVWFLTAGTVLAVTRVILLVWFRNRVDAKVGIEQWRRHYNEVRPHSSLGYLTPMEFKAADAARITTGRSAATPPHADQDERTTQHDGPTEPMGAILQ